MNSTDFLEAIKLHDEEETKDLMLRCKPTKDDPQQYITRAPQIYRMRLKKSSAAQKLAPYIIHQVITESNTQEKGRLNEHIVCLRSVFCVYWPEDEEEGSLSLLLLMERVINGWLRDVVISKRFELDVNQGIEQLIYPDDTGDFFAGEAVSYWRLPAMQREVRAFGYNE